MAEGMLDMSASERERLFLIAQAVGKRLLQQVVAERLGIGLRQVKRLVRAYRGHGDAGLVSPARACVESSTGGRSSRAGERFAVRQIP